jgi:hypothetical protein
MRDHWRNQPDSVRRAIRSLFWLALLVCSFLSQPLPAQTSASQEKPVHHYVLIFRPTRKLTADELKQRAVEIPLWVQRVTDMGIKLDPKALGEFAVRFSQQDGTVVTHDGSADPSLTNLVFFDAPGQEQAIEVARIHPGLHYAVTVELREWTSPVPAPARQN